MKVYFQGSGFSWGPAGKETISFRAFVSPQKDGSGYFYNCLGKRCHFWRAEPRKAKVYDSKELPKDLLFAFKHGVKNFELPAEKEENWTPEDLMYKKVDRKKLMLFNRVQKALPNINSIEEFWKLCPLIEECGYISPEMVNTLFAILSIPHASISNGEIGIAQTKDIVLFIRICERFYNKPIEYIKIKLKKNEQN